MRTEAKMYSKAFSAGLVLFSAVFIPGPARAADGSFQLVKQDDKVSVYGKRPENCVSDGASVMFVVENHTKERLELRLELLNMKVKNSLTLTVEPSGNTSVLSLSPDPDACRTELVGMKVSPMPAKGMKPVPATASESAPASATPVSSEPAAVPANPIAADRVL